MEARGRRGAATRRSRGFTLLELLLVCALLVLAAGLTASFLSGSDRKAFSVDLRRVSAELINARRRAIITGVEQHVTLTTALTERDSRAAEPEPLPDWSNPGMRLRYAASLDDSLEEATELVVDFFPMGSSTGGVIELSDMERKTYLYVSPFTGKLIVEPELEDLEARIEEGRL